MLGKHQWSARCAPPGHVCSSRSLLPAPGKQQLCAPSRWPGPKTAVRCSAWPRRPPRRPSSPSKPASAPTAGVDLRRLFLGIDESSATSCPTGRQPRDWVVPSAREADEVGALGVAADANGVRAGRPRPADRPAVPRRTRECRHDRRERRILAARSSSSPSGRDAATRRSLSNSTSRSARSRVTPDVRCSTCVPSWRG
jgi:hypothetical protein